MRSSQDRPGESGAAAMLSMAIIAILFILVVSGLVIVQLSKATVNRQLIYHGQAINAANAGLVESLSWFRRQASQPVTAFAPQVDALQTPPINDTDDPSVGLVRDFEISDLGSVWGRYEVPYPRVRDVSGARGQPGAGSVWLVDSVGIVYVRSDPTKPYNQPPNRVLTRTYARTEVQRMSIVPPANAAICVSRADAITTESKTRILGGSYGVAIAYPPATGTTTLNGTTSGLMQTTSVTPYKDSIAEVFGVDQQQLIAMADVVAADAAGLPRKLPEMALVVVTGNAVFDVNRPLIGSGVMVTLGDLRMQAGSLSSYNGLIYVGGDYEQSAPSQVSGTVIVGGQVTLRSAGDFSEVYYDPSVLSQITRHIGQYRFSRSPALLDG